jgi:phosphate transport system ATP-binding protein
MVFQRPNPFPTMSIAQNVAAGLRFGPRELRRAAHTGEVVERSSWGQNGASGSAARHGPP